MRPIVIDTREQIPWSFPPYVPTMIGTLKNGDYALQGDTQFSIERKSAGDFLGTISSGWGRFCRELNRMDAAGYSIKVIIVEGDLSLFTFSGEGDTLLPPCHEHFLCSPQFVFKRIAELTMRGASVLFASDPELASALALRILLEREKELENGNNCKCK